ncbi:MAG: hypothetical protein C4343_05580 [Chloroflexota bacterium]
MLADGLRCHHEGEALLYGLGELRGVPRPLFFEPPPHVLSHLFGGAGRIAGSAAVGETLLVEAGVVWFGRRPDGFEAASLETLGELGIPVERLTAADVRERWPQIAIADDEFAVFEPEAGLLLARQAIRRLVERFVAAGGGFEVAAVRAPDPSAPGDRLTAVETTDGRRLTAERFVFAAGPWLPQLFPALCKQLIRITKQDVLYLGPPAGDDAWEAERFPCWVDYDAAIYGIPAVAGRGVKVAPDELGRPFDPTDGERLVDPETVRIGRRYVRRRFPALAEAPVVETRVCQYESTPDTHFVIDRHPAFANLWLVGGGSGHGFKHGPVIGETVVGLVTGEPTEPAIGDRFALGRPRQPDPGYRTAGHQD